MHQCTLERHHDRLQAVSPPLRAFDAITSEVSLRGSKHRSFSAELPPEARRSVTLNIAEVNSSSRFGTTKLKTHDCEIAGASRLFTGKFAGHLR